MSDELRDAWLIDGNCTKCRREKYCSKLCTKAKKRRESFIRNMVYERTGIGQMLNVIDKLSNGI